MKIFIDTASVTEIKNIIDTGILDGITTNPSLIAREKLQTGKKFIPIVTEICEAFQGPVSVEVLSTTTKMMIEEARSLAKIAPNIVVKLPCIPESLKATKILTEDGIKTNLTLCFSPMQAMLVAKAGATYVSPFVGRLDDIGVEGMRLIADIKAIFFNYQYKTEILVASIRNPIHILEAARIGADVVTVPYAVIKQLMQHPLTDKGLQAFLEDARNASEGGSR